MKININFFDNFDFIIFDFDGVILETNEIKNLSFKKLFSSYKKKQVDEFIYYHKKNGGISRYEKINYFFKSNQIKINERIFQKYLLKFSRIVKKKIIKAKYVPGVRKFIGSLSKKKIPLFIISGSDQKELIQICKKRKIVKFLKIYGSPTTKFENFKKVLNYLKYINKNDKKGLVIGDSKLDYMISFKNKIPFLYIEQFSEWKLDKDYNKKQNFYKLYNFNKIIYE